MLKVKREKCYANANHKETAVAFLTSKNTGLMVAGGLGGKEGFAPRKLH